jgi:hypothetical protein
VLALWGEREADTAGAEIGVGALDVVAVKEEVGVRQAIRNCPAARQALAG